MRYFLPLWALAVAIVISVMGFRGGSSRKPPIEIFPDMDRQMKVRPQQPHDFFTDGRGSRLPVAGTVARSTPLNSVASSSGIAYAFEENAVTTGRIAGSTNFIEINPMEIGAQSMARGRDRYQINCLPCHGPLGDGNGVTKKLGMAVVANLHDGRLVKMADGELFQIVSQGKNLMSGYASQLSVEDRWAVVAYVRALQRSRLGSLDDVAPEFRSSLKK